MLSVNGKSELMQFAYLAGRGAQDAKLVILIQAGRKMARSTPSFCLRTVYTTSQ